MSEPSSFDCLDTQTGVVCRETNLEFFVLVILGVVVFALYPLAVVSVLA